MKNKTVTIILSVILITCIGVNIYQYMTTSRLRESLSVLTNSKNEITTDIENTTIELNDITSDIEVANATISELNSKVDSLTSSINDTQLEIDSINSTHTDIELGDDEYKGDNGNDALQNSYNNLTEDRQAEVDAALERAKQRHPDWFQDDSTGNTNQGNYEHVGTPSTGQYINPDYNLNEGDYSGLEGGQVY